MMQAHPTSQMLIDFDQWQRLCVSDEPHAHQGNSAVAIGRRTGMLQEGLQC
jgi:hypothetical protein